jgi:2-oxoglutarate dehydrogenase complex dehydrogenase (E1) component-like enzyme
MGSWRFLREAFRDKLERELIHVAREESASPATGSLRIHAVEQAVLIDRALEGLKA